MWISYAGATRSLFVKAIYKLEEMSDMENEIMEALNIKDLHNKRPKIKGVGVYS